MSAFTDMTEAERCEALARVQGWTLAGNMAVPNGWWVQTGMGIDLDEQRPDWPNPFRVPADHWALREWADGQGILAVAYGGNISLDTKPRLFVAAKRLGETDALSREFDSFDYPAQVAAEVEAIGRLVGAWA